MEVCESLGKYKCNHHYKINAVRKDAFKIHSLMAYHFEHLITDIKLKMIVFKTSIQFIDTG